MRQIKVAFLDIDDTNQRPLKSVLSICTRSLETEFEWVAVENADICVINVHGHTLRPDHAVLVRYAAHKNGAAYDIARPVQTRTMLAVFAQAIKDVEKRAPAYARTGVSTKRYRGAIVE